MEHQFHLAAFVICLTIWLGFGQALAVPPIGSQMAQSELTPASYEHQQILHRVARQFPQPPPPPPTDMPPMPEWSTFRRKREAKGGGSMPTRKG